MSGWGNILFAAAGFLAGAIFFALLFGYWKKRQTARVLALEDYLEQAVMGSVPLCKSLGEDAFSRLEDEIY